MPTGIGSELLAEARKTLAKAHHKIEHCFAQLTNRDVTWRPRPEMNSIAIVINHLCGNIRQWIISGLGGVPDARNRPAEFEDPGQVTIAQLREKLNKTMGEVDAVLTRLDPADLLRVRRVQGFEVTGMHALFDTITHFVGHTHQILQWTRMLRGDAYKFDFVPKTPEQGAPPQKR